MGSITHRGLLWAGGLAATPLPPSGAFSYPDVTLPWEGATSAPRTSRHAGTDPAIHSGFPDIAPPIDPAPIRRP